MKTTCLNTCWSKGKYLTLILQEVVKSAGANHTFRPAESTLILALNPYRDPSAPLSALRQKKVHFSHLA